MAKKYLEEWLTEVEDPNSAVRKQFEKDKLWEDSFRRLDDEWEANQSKAKDSRGGDRKQLLSERYPEANGCGELAILVLDGFIGVAFIARTKDGEEVSGVLWFAPGDKHYAEVLRAHKFDQPEAKGRGFHEIATRYFPGTDREPVDVAEEWHGTEWICGMPAFNSE